ncbi:MAG TPA: PsbP-related protein [Nitrososphaeraceae archaeon]|jgi:hypothetical protein
MRLSNRDWHSSIPLHHISYKPTRNLIIFLIAILYLPVSYPSVSTGNVWAITNNPNPNPSSLQEYKNDTYAVSVQYPANWEVRPGENNSGTDSTIDIATLSPRESNSSASFDLLVDSVDSGLNLKQYVLDSITANKVDLKDYKVLETEVGNITIAGLPGYSLLYTFSDSGEIMKGLETGMIKGNKVYFVQYENSQSQYYKDLTTAHKMISSLKVGTPITVIRR